jgi:hypothetical protein
MSLKIDTLNDKIKEISQLKENDKYTVNSKNENKDGN